VITRLPNHFARQEKSTLASLVIDPPGRVQYGISYACKTHGTDRPANGGESWLGHSIADGP
jgi:hypothetical protein